MSRSANLRSKVLVAAAALVFFACTAHHLLSPYSSASPYHDPILRGATVSGGSAVIQEERVGSYPSRPHTKWWPQQPQDAVLFQDWEVLLLLPPEPETNKARDEDESSTRRRLVCLFQDGSISPASSSGVLPWSRNSIKRCSMPPKARHSQPFLVPKLIAEDPATDGGVYSENSVEGQTTASPYVGTAPAKELLRWNHLVYESLSTETDVIVFAKGINNRQGSSRQPGELRCVFYPAGSSPSSKSPVAVRTPVTSSSQEVFRCGHPDLLEFPTSGQEASSSSAFEMMSVTIEYTATGRAIPSIARYQGRRRPSPAHQDVGHHKPPEEKKSFLCTCTMGYNIAKFLPEWTTYHASIGVDHFFLYDNGSEDDLAGAVSALRDKQGINITSYLWPWPKTQEAGFSHCAALHRRSCTWMMYIDVDEFVLSPSWSRSPHPARGMLPSLLPAINSSSSTDGDHNAAAVGQVMINCLDFGPSNQTSHPPSGVTQGYTCRIRAEERHKSVVLLDAVDPSLLNVVHHFQLAPGFSSRRLRLPAAAVNHYKYQAWPEFRNKFRRRVSAYVVDWTKAVNAASKDRAPGLGFEAVEPEGWAGRFCEVRDTRLRELTRKWFAPAGDDRLAWEDMLGRNRNRSDKNVGGYLLEMPRVVAQEQKIKP